MGIDSFMQGCKAARQARDERAFAALFTPDGQYHDTLQMSRRQEQA